jgi:hypothetical protein
MIDLLYAVGACTEVVGAWEVSRQPEGLVVRLRTPQTYDSKTSATEAAEQMVKCVLPGGYETLSTSAAARAERGGSEVWRGLAEVVVGVD